MEHNLTISQCRDLTAQLACALQDAIMANRLDDDYKGFLDLWEDLAAVEILCRHWNDRPDEVRHRLIREAMEDCV
jgi:hypothetical protein